MQNNMLDLWRRHFVLEDNLHEINSTCLTPLVVLETSGHVERFKDLMCQDQGDGTCHRADHLLEDKIKELLEKHASGKEPLTPEQVEEYERMKIRADDMSAEELGAALKQLNVKSPDSGNELSAPFPFNLMFETKIGPTGLYTGFMRPELAQGIFVNFHRLLEQNGGAMPFGGACIGRAFRNEISPRQGLLRVREFTLAEIEFFVHPDKKNDHDRFDDVKDVQLNLWPRAQQLAADNRYLRMTIGDAVEQKLVDNKTLGYYLARCQLFLVSAGARPEWVRFRQHLENEMAHYASDCWDAELLTSYGWIECVGNADRAAYDLTVHMKKTGKQLTCWERFDEPQVLDVVAAEANKGVIGKSFRGEAGTVFEHLSGLDNAAVTQLSEQLAANPTGVAITAANGKDYTITPQMVNFVQKKVKVTGRHIVPSVVEPSYGIGRIQYALLEQCFFQRPEDKDRGVLSLAASIAPIKASVLPLMVKPALLPPAKRIAQLLTAAGIAAKVDYSGNTIGRRYARTDEIGIPFGITVDYVTIEDPNNPLFDTVTLRERDSTKQIRVPINELAPVLQSLCNLQKTWTELLDKYPVQEAPADDDAAEAASSSSV